MTPFPVTVRYRYGEDGASRDASFYGLFFDRSEEAVLGRLKEAHRFAAWVEIVEMRWRDGAAPARERRQGGGRQCGHPAEPRERAPVQRGGGRPRGAGAEPAAGAPASGAEGTPEDRPWQVRRHHRCRMFKPAHLVLDDAVLDCVLLDLSPGGAQVCLLAQADLPDLVTLWLPGGEGRRVRRRWRRGSRVGFEAVGDAFPPS